MNPRPDDDRHSQPPQCFSQVRRYHHTTVDNSTQLFRDRGNFRFRVASCAVLKRTPARCAVALQVRETVSVAYEWGSVPWKEHCKVASKWRAKSADAFVRETSARTFLTEPLSETCANASGPTRRMWKSPSSVTAIRATRDAISPESLQCRLRCSQRSTRRWLFGRDRLFHRASQFARAVIGHPKFRDASTYGGLNV